MNKSFLLILFLSLMVSAEDELQIETTFTPIKCEETPQKGDMLEMHYTVSFHTFRSNLLCRKTLI